MILKGETVVVMQTRVAAVEKGKSHQILDIFEGKGKRMVQCSRNGMRRNSQGLFQHSMSNWEDKAAIYEIEKTCKTG